MDKAAQKSKTEAGRKPVEHAGAGAPVAETQEPSGKRPLWSRTINRVEGSMWKHDHEGAPRYTVSISRSYLNRKTNQWKRDHYFDRRDLADVAAVCREAEEHILVLEGLTQTAGED